MRPSIDWILIPLMALPLVVAAGLCVFAHGTHQDEIAAARENGAELAATWLSEGGPADAFRARFLQQHAQAVDESESTSGQAWMRFVHPRCEGLLKLELPGEAPTWQFTDTLPVGLGVQELVKDKVRMHVEGGTPPVRAGDVDEATRALDELLVDVGNVSRLASAPLSAATKRFVVSHWMGHSSFSKEHGALTKALSALALLFETTDEMREPLQVGATSMEGATAFSVGPRRPVVLQLGDAPTPWPSSSLLGPSDSPLKLRWSPTPATQTDDHAWSGRINKPLAGYASFVHPTGASWWRSPKFARWVVPAALLLLAVFVLPLLLFMSLRRRRKLDEQRVRFINEIAHDLRTPLTSVRLYADLLAKNSANHEVRERHVKTLRRESSRLTALLGNLLDLSRLDGSAGSLAREPVNIKDAVELAVSDFSLVHAARAGDVSIEGAGGVVALADRAALSRVLANLLDNAGKYSSQGVPIGVAWTAAENGVRIVVSDEGPGIPASDAERVFRRYERRAEHVAAGVQGSGLGLALVKELATAMEGDVRLVPSSEGTSIEVRLPAHIGVDA